MKLPHPARSLQIGAWGVVLSALCVWLATFPFRFMYAVPRGGVNPDEVLNDSLLGIGLAALLMTAYAFHKHREMERLWLRWRAGLCEFCGYPASGRADRCPECGRTGRIAPRYRVSATNATGDQVMR